MLALVLRAKLPRETHDSGLGTQHATPTQNSSLRTQLLRQGSLSKVIALDSARKAREPLETHNVGVGA